MIKKIIYSVGCFVLGLSVLMAIYIALMFCGFIMSVGVACVGVNATVVIMCVVALIAGAVTQAIKSRVETA